MITVDKRKAKSLLRKAVASRGPETVVSDGGCLYVVDSKPSCMIGEALSEVMPLDDLVLFSQSTGPYNNPLNSVEISEDYVVAALKDRGVHLTKGAVEVFDCAQQAQDSQRQWFEALDQALAL